jgi:hypothetical protein
MLAADAYAFRRPMVSLLARSCIALSGLALLLAAVPAHAAMGKRVRWVHAGHIGEKGTGPGKFPDKTGGIAVDQDCGDVFIADPEQRRIHKFSMNGRHLATFGDSSGAGRIDEPHGIEIRQTFGGRVNIDGPPPACGPITTVSPTLMVTNWAGSSESTARVSFYALDGSFDGAWCEEPMAGCTKTGSITPFAGGPADPNGIDPFPNDVDAKGDRIWISGALEGRIREYDTGGQMIRRSEDRLNPPTGPSSLSAGDAPAYLWASDDSRSQVALMDLNPANRSINPITSLGGGGYDSNTPGKFGYPQGVEVGPAGRFFDDLFVVDGERVQVFTPGGDNGSLISRPELRGVIELPGSNYAGEYVDVRYDGTIYVTGRHSAGADVYTPGVVLRFRVKALKDRRIRLSGRIFPPHARRRIRFDRLEQGWESIGRVALREGTFFKHVWRAPRAGKTYALRAFFTDPHRYHADRASEIKFVRAKD